MTNDENVNRVTYCECGCGNPSPVAMKNNTRDGTVRGRPQRFIRGHSGRGKIGQLSANWTGGRVVSNGYIQIMQPSHPSANSGGYVYEHTLIAEHALGRALPINAEVHHANTVKIDNRNSNLVICEDHGYHALLHKRMRAYQATGNPLAVQCRHCFKWGIVGEADMSTTRFANGRQKQAYHRSCESNYYRALRRDNRKDAS